MVVEMVLICRKYLSLTRFIQLKIQAQITTILSKDILIFCQNQLPWMRVEITGKLKSTKPSILIIMALEKLIKISDPFNLITFFQRFIDMKTMINSKESSNK